MTYRRNIIRKNYIHDLNNNSLGESVVGIYLDDCFSSAHVYKNKIENVPLAILAGGGRGNIIEENIINNCTKSISFDDRGLPGSNYDTLKSRLNDVPYNNKIWIKKYQHLRIYVYLYLGMLMGHMVTYLLIIPLLFYTPKWR